MSTDTPNSRESARQQLQELLAGIEQLALRESPPERFYTDFLQRIAGGLGADAGLVLLAVSTNSESGGEGDNGALSSPDLRVAARFEPDRTEAGAFSILDQLRGDGDHTEVLDRVLSQVQAESVPPGRGNPTARVLLIVPLPDPQTGRPFGILELLKPSGLDAAAIENYLRLMDRMGRQAAVFRRLSGAGAGQRQSQEHWQFLHAVHASLDRRQTACTIVNEGRLLTGCERLSLALWDGQRCVLEAVSGQGWFERRSRSVMLLEQLATQVASTQQPLWYGNGSPPPQHLAAAIMEYVDATKAREIVVVPIVQADESTASGGHDVSTGPRPPLSTLLIAEQFSASAPPRLDERLQTIGRISAPALANAIEHENIPFLSTMQRFGRMHRGARTSKGRTILGILFGILLALLIIPAGLDMEARGELLPVDRANVFAKTDGIIEEVHVSHGESVSHGQLLVTMRDADVDSELIRLDGERNATAARLRAVRATLLSNRGLSRSEHDQFAAEQGQLERTLDGLQTRLAIHQQTVDTLQVKSPRDGIVQTWDVRKLLINRPVRRGQMLMTVADPAGSWELEIRMPGHRMGHLQQAQKTHGDDLPVEFVLASEPGRRFPGHIRQVHDRAEVHDETGHTVLISVDVNRDDVGQLKPGTEVVARVECGWRPIGYVWFHELYEFVQKQLLFRL